MAKEKIEPKKSAQVVEYKVVSAHMPVAEETLNLHALDGWRLVQFVKSDEKFILVRNVPSV